MPIQSFDQKCIALTQLETSLRLYFEGSDYFSVITLAGAAEEIFGRMLSAKGIKNSLESKKRTVSQISEKLFGRPVSPKWTADRANKARNVLKHLTSPTVTFDLKEEARDILDRAISNYCVLEEWLTPAMERFYQEVV